MRTNINEDPDSVYDEESGQLLASYMDNTPAISFFCLVDTDNISHKWAILDRRNFGSAPHTGIYLNDQLTPAEYEIYKNADRMYLRGRIWMEQKICSFYASKSRFGPLEIKRVNDLFRILELNPADFRFEYRSGGLEPWIGLNSFSSDKETSSPSAKDREKIKKIEKQLNNLQATLHLKVGEDRRKVEREVDRLEKELGKISTTAARKHAYMKNKKEKLYKYAKGGGGFLAGYYGRLPALEEEKLRVYNKSLCPDIWEGDILKPVIRSTLLKIIRDFIRFSKIKINLNDVYLLGSMANYNWNKTSDLDLHLLIDVSNLGIKSENLESMLKSLAGKWNNEHDIQIKGHKVEIYFQDVSEKNSSEGIYSLFKNSWVKIPGNKPPVVDTSAIRKEYSKWKDKILSAIASKNEGVLKNILDQLKVYRQRGLNIRGEFSTENLTFKVLRVKGLLAKVKETFNTLYDEKMSILDGLDPLSAGPNPATGDPEFYRNHNKRMRQLEITKKDLKYRHPNFPISYSEIEDEFFKLTLDNLNSLVNKLRKKKAYIANKIKTQKIPNEYALEGSLEIIDDAIEKIKKEIDRRIKKINQPNDQKLKEGYGAGKIEQDRLKVKNADGTVRRWTIRSKDAPKTPSMKEEIDRIIQDVLNRHFPLI